MAKPARFDVFLSHSRYDKPFVEDLARRLENEAGLTVWLDEWHLIPGEPWQEGIETALDQCQAYAICIGPSGFGAWHHEEMRLALSARVLDTKRRVIPVLLPGCDPDNLTELPRFLAQLTWIDFRGGLDDQASFNRLVAGIRGVPPGRDINGDTEELAPTIPGHEVQTKKGDSGIETTGNTGYPEGQPKDAEVPGPISNVAILDGARIKGSNVNITVGHSTGHKE